MKRKLLTFISLNLFFISVYSQSNNSPVPFEIFAGNNRSSVQLNLKRTICNKIDFSNLTIATADYKNTVSENELIMINSFVYQFHKNINIGGGLQYHFKKGFIPNVSISLNHIDATWMFLLTPYFQFLPTRNIETICIIEFKPKLTEKLRLYSRVQGLYNYNFAYNGHERSFFDFRLGLKINKFAFGAASNIDYYGPKKIFKENYGAFLKIDM